MFTFDNLSWLVAAKTWDALELKLINGDVKWVNFEHS